MVSEKLSNEAYVLSVVDKCISRISGYFDTGKFPFQRNGSVANVMGIHNNTG
jgi:hypothetical protein